MILFTQQFTVYNCMTNHSMQFECWNFFLKQHAICCKTGIRNDDVTQVTHVLYTHCSSDNRPAKIVTSYNTHINYYGHYKLGLQLNETLMLNRSQGFKFPNNTVTSNCAEGLDDHTEGLIIVSCVGVYVWRVTGSRSNLLTFRLQSLLITINTVALLIHTLSSSPLHAHTRILNFQ
jgi:hypothetical protein